MYWYVPLYILTMYVHKAMLHVQYKMFKQEECRNLKVVKEGERELED